MEPPSVSTQNCIASSHMSSDTQPNHWSKTNWKEGWTRETERERETDRQRQRSWDREKERERTRDRDREKKETKTERRPHTERDTETEGKCLHTRHIYNI